MDALVMCGGRGTRLEAAVEKPLFEVGGRPMVDRVIEALEGSRVETVHGVVSPAAPRTREHLDCRIVDAPGDGYVEDLRYALERVEPPVLTVAADLPLLDGDAVDAVLAERDADSLAVCVPVSLRRRLGVSVDATTTVDGRSVAPAGINVVSDGDEEDALVTDDVRYAVNVNRPSDARIAEKLL